MFDRRTYVSPSRTILAPASAVLWSALAIAATAGCDAPAADDETPAATRTDAHRFRSGSCTPIQASEGTDYSNSMDAPTALGTLCQGVNVISGELLHPDSFDSIQLDLISGQIVSMELVVSNHVDSSLGTTRVGVGIRRDGVPREEASLGGDGSLALPTAASSLQLPAGAGSYEFDLYHNGALPGASSDWELRITVSDCPFIRGEAPDFPNDATSPVDLGDLCPGVNVISGELFDLDSRDAFSVGVAAGTVSAMELIVSNHEDSPGFSTHVGLALDIDGRPREEASLPGDGILAWPREGAALDLPAEAGQYDFVIQHTGRMPDARSDWMVKITVDPGDPECEADLSTCEGDLATCETDQVACEQSRSACEAARSQTQSELAASEALRAQVQAAFDAATEDLDGDGLRSLDDDCPDTPAETAVDRAGCSLVQFCATYPIVTLDDKKRCRKADWGNDEPLGALDCHVVGGASCEPREAE